jgi:hypothetical protein
MAVWIETGILIAILAAGPAIALYFELRARFGRRASPGPDRPPRAEPCWQETIGREGDRVHARSQCVDDVLMEMDARAARGDFPIPKTYGD